jgi:hypothetical protein
LVARARIPGRQLSSIAALASAVNCTTPAPPCPPPLAPTGALPTPPASVIPAASVAPPPSAEPAASAVASATVAPPPPAVAREGQEFVGEARLLYRITACAGDAPLPAEIQKIVDEHCRELLPKIQDYKTSWVDVARPFLANVVPADAKKVVYPFAGGDNTTMLVTYPNAEEYTTMSLELTGDVRKVNSVTAKSLGESLKRLRRRLDELLGKDKFSQSETLQKMMQGDVPQELSFLMVGLAIHDMEPVSLRYFRIENDGGLHYFTAEDIAKEKTPARRRSQTWGDGDFSEAFSNVEIAFKPRGKEGPIQVHRHIAHNLDNVHMKNSALLKHLDAKGDVAMMIKAASYLLWNLNFTRTRDYVLKHATFIISDSTAPLPKDASAAGFMQTVWGRYAGARIPVLRQPEKEMKAFWASQPEQPIPFRFGYLDVGSSPHLMITKRK